MDNFCKCRNYIKCLTNNKTCSIINISKERKNKKMEIEKTIKLTEEEMAKIEDVIDIFEEIAEVTYEDSISSIFEEFFEKWNYKKNPIKINGFKIIVEE